MTQRIITYAFYILFFLTPLVWTPWNYELFEYNKMMLVYLLTVIIGGGWVFRMVREQKLLIKRTPLDIPLLLFLGANFLSTIFSIDSHTSWWGYYSRSNGGLLSLISYLVLYYALVSNFKFEQAVKFLKAALFGGLIVSLWAIPEHFGVSPSCVLLTGRFDANCWVQDVQARVFATLGQPNWLAAYLAMLIFPAIYFILTSKTRFATIRYALCTICLYLAFTFTYSRGVMLGLLGGLGVFIVLFLLRFQLGVGKLEFGGKIRPLVLVIGSFFIINLLFGSALTNFKLLSKFAPPPRPSLSIPGNPSSSVTQLENGGTESGTIRLIVWRGALEIFKHYPIFGSGLETFAYSYYNFRPASHNLVSEWDFLYNKAHNEFLNYLATTGAVGFLTYLGVIVTFIVWSVRCVMDNGLGAKKQDKLITPHSSLITISLLASYSAYLIQNFFGFSVVIIALYFYIFPAFSFLEAGDALVSKKPRFLVSYLNHLRNLSNLTIYRRPGYKKITLGIICALSFYLLFTLVKFWVADTLFAKGNNYSDQGNPGRAYNNLIDAVDLNPGEPFYHNELGYAAASAAVSLASDTATGSADLSAKLKTLGVNETVLSLTISPRNVSFWRTAIRTFYALSSLDPAYNQKTIDVLDTSIKLAPTDPKLYYNKGLILEQLGRYGEASKSLQKAIDLRSNYREAYLSLGEFYKNQAQLEKDEVKKLKLKQMAIDQYNIVLKLIPNDQDAVKGLDAINKI